MYIYLDGVDDKKYMKHWGCPLGPVDYFHCIFGESLGNLPHRFMQFPVDYVKQPSFVEEQAFPSCFLPRKCHCSFLQSMPLPGENVLVRNTAPGGRCLTCFQTSWNRSKSACSIIGNPADRLMEALQFPQITNYQWLQLRSIQETYVSTLNRTAICHLKVSPLF